MATDYVTTKSTRWNAALADCLSCEAALAAIQDHPESRARSGISALATDAVERLSAVPAPTVLGIRDKLERFWTNLAENTCEARFKRTILGDLMRIGLLLAGVEADEASGGMNLDKIASDWSQAAAEFDRYSDLIRHDPSPEWGASTCSDITALLDEAESKLLACHAPNLAAVEKKLTTLWSDDRFDEIDGTNVPARVLRDLRRFILGCHP